MERVESVSHLKDVLRTYQCGRKRIYTNCFLLKEELEKKVLNGKMFFDNETDTLQVLYDEGPYYHLYFYAPLDRPFTLSERDKPILCDMLCTDPLRERDALAQKRLGESGFALHAQNRQFIIPISKHIEEAAHSIFDKIIGRMSESGYELEAAKWEDLEEINNLWRRNLDEFAFVEVTENEWKKACFEERIHYIRDSSGGLCAARWYENTGKSSWEHHITVSASCRGKGFAQVLLSRQIIEAGAAGCGQVICWIEQGNISSIRLHQVWGGFNNKISKQYIKYARE